MIGGTGSHSDCGDNDIPSLRLAAEWLGPEPLFNVKPTSVDLLRAIFIMKLRAVCKVAELAKSKVGFNNHKFVR